MIHLSICHPKDYNVERSFDDEEQVSKRSFPSMEFLFKNRFYDVYSIFDIFGNNNSYKKELEKEIDELYGTSPELDIVTQPTNDEETLSDEDGNENDDDNDNKNTDDNLDDGELEESNSENERRVYDLRPRLTTINYKEK